MQLLVREPTKDGPRPVAGGNRGCVERDAGALRIHVADVPPRRHEQQETRAVCPGL